MNQTRPRAVSLGRAASVAASYGRVSRAPSGALLGRAGYRRLRWADMASTCALVALSVFTASGCAHRQACGAPDATPAEYEVYKVLLPYVFRTAAAPVDPRLNRRPAPGTPHDPFALTGFEDDPAACLTHLDVPLPTAS